MFRSPPRRTTCRLRIGFNIWTFLLTSCSMSRSSTIATSIPCRRLRERCRSRRRPRSADTPGSESSLPAFCESKESGPGDPAASPFSSALESFDVRETWDRYSQKSRRCNPACARSAACEPCCERCRRPRWTGAPGAHRRSGTSSGMVEATEDEPKESIRKRRASCSNRIWLIHHDNGSVACLPQLARCKSLFYQKPSRKVIPPARRRLDPLNAL